MRLAAREARRSNILKPWKSWKAASFMSASKNLLFGTFFLPTGQGHAFVFVLYYKSDDTHTPYMRLSVRIQKEGPFMAITNVNTSNFNQEVLHAGKPVLVDFYADWCGPCRMMSPIVDEIAAERQDVKVCKVNIDEQPALAQQYGVMSIPTMIVFQSGQPVAQHVGAQPKSGVLAMLG